MRNAKLLPLIAAVMLSASGLPAAFAQSPTTVPAARFPAVAMPVDLETGPIAVRDYVDHLQQITGLNIILLNDQGVDTTRISLPPLKLKQMPAYMAIGLLSDLPGAHMTVEQRDDVFVVIAHAPEVVGGGFDGGMGGPLERSETKVFALEKVFFANSELTESLIEPAERSRVLEEKVPQTLKLIEEALSIDNASTTERAAIKLHQGTNTLIVRGTPGQLATINEVIKAVAPPAPTDEAKAYSTKLQEQQLKSAQDRSRLEIELQAQRDAVPRYLKEIDALREKLEVAHERIRALGVEPKEQKPTGEPTPSNKPNQP